MRKEWNEFHHYFFNSLNQLISFANTYDNSANDRKKTLGANLWNIAQKYLRDSKEKHLTFAIAHCFLFYARYIRLCNEFDK